MGAEAGIECGCGDENLVEDIIFGGADAGGTGGSELSAESESHIESLDGTVGASDSFVLD